MKSLLKRFLPRKLVQTIVEMRREKKGRENEKTFNGNNVFCPCCEKRFAQFMDFEFSDLNNAERYVNTYKNTTCPYCEAYPRHRIIGWYFDQNKEIIPRSNILMIGPEPSIVKWFKRNNCRFTTADLFERSADTKVDVQNMPFPDEKWDMIICNHVLEHVPDFRLALRELWRVLKKDGILELTVPTDRSFETVFENRDIVEQEERVRMFGQADHVRIFGNDFADILQELDFLVEIISGNDLPSEIVGVVGPVNYDDNRVYICKKN